MKMHALSGGRLRMRKSIYLPDAAREETIELPVSSFLVRHRQGNVLFDTGCNPSVAEHAEQRWGGMAKLMTPIFGPQENVLIGLQQLGFDPEDIDVVISSHLHPDHCGCNRFFTKATILCHAKELEAARRPEAEKAGCRAQLGDGLEQLAAVADRGHPEGLQVLGGQFRQDIGVDLVVLERLILEPEVPKPGGAGLGGTDGCPGSAIYPEADKKRVMQRHGLIEAEWARDSRRANLSPLHRRRSRAPRQLLLFRDDR
jgi:hypothetical protein